MNVRVNPRNAPAPEIRIGQPAPGEAFWYAGKLYVVADRRCSTQLKAHTDDYVPVFCVTDNRVTHFTPSHSNEVSLAGESTVEVERKPL